MVLSDIMDLSSTESVFLFSWLKTNTIPSTDSASLAWFVGCEFLWSEYANDCMRQSQQALDYNSFESVLKIIYGDRIKRQLYNHMAAKVDKRDRRSGRDGKTYTFETFKDVVKPVLIFSGIRYLKDGEIALGL